MKVLTVHIKQIEAKKKRYVVHTEAHRFVLDEETLLKFRLVVGKALEEADIEAIQAYDDDIRGLHQAYHYLSFKPRSVAQMKEYLRTKEVHSIETVIATLKGKDYLNDEQTAQWIVEQTIIQKKGANAAKQKLIQAKIHPSIIDRALSAYGVDDAHAAATTRVLSWCKPTKKSLTAFKASLLQKLVGAGFSFDTAHQVMQDQASLIEAQVDEPTAIALWLDKNHGLSANKTIQKLMQQGFAYATIRHVLDERSD